MKKLFICILFLSFISCQKDNLKDKISSSYFTSLDNNTDIWKLIEYENDTLYNHTNWVLLQVAKAIKKAVKNEAFKKVIIDAMWNSDLPGIALTEIIKNNIKIKEAIEEEIKISITNSANNPFNIPFTLFDTPNWSIISFLEGRMSYRGFSQEIYLHFAKDKSKKLKSYDDIVLAIGEQVTEEDEIIGWQEDKLVLISETKAKEFSGSVIIINNTSHIDIDNLSTDEFNLIDKNTNASFPNNQINYRSAYKGSDNFIFQCGFSPLC